MIAMEAGLKKLSAAPKMAAMTMSSHSRSSLRASSAAVTPTVAPRRKSDVSITMRRRGAIDDDATDQGEHDRRNGARGEDQGDAIGMVIHVEGH